MDALEKLEILTDAAKYDVSCASSGSSRGGKSAAERGASMGSAMKSGICHSFSGDGRCISLLKILASNCCIYDCKYCVNRRSNDVPRTTFTAREIAELTINFYKRNYIEGLFLSSGVVKNPDYTMELICEAVRLLREEYGFAGYIHAKTVPGADPLLIKKLGLMADRISVNIEMPSEESLKTFAPDKSRNSILKPMGQISGGIKENRHELALYKSAPKFAPAGHSTQMIIGASPETDLRIIKLTEGLYKKYNLKRVYFSAYVPVGNHPALPHTKPPLMREHRLYQADWLLRFYGFRADEILTEENPNFNELLDPKCTWAINHPELFPVEVNRADYNMLLRVPGVGVRSAKRIVSARRYGRLDFANLKKMGVVLKRARYFLVCGGKYLDGITVDQKNIERNMLADAAMSPQNAKKNSAQLSMFDEQFALPPKNEVMKSITGEL